ncbi:hypothetical protein ACQKNS_25480 [Peribacillus sp. NPDC094092]|uniref:hypothetical protein n=1 Tax=Peribacillus sp. NPDC094092 TaxID=3390611 RepID=UPI003D027408
MLLLKVGMDMGQKGMGPHHMMGHHHDGFTWLWLVLFLILGMAALILAVKWLRKKSKTSALEQFIDTSLVSSYRPSSNPNTNVLDQWEKNIVNKKETTFLSGR